MLPASTPRLRRAAALRLHLVARSWRSVRGEKTGHFGERTMCRTPKRYYYLKISSKEGKIDHVQAEHAPEERLVAPIPWATLSVHVVPSPASHAGSGRAKCT